MASILPLSSFYTFSQKQSQSSSQVRKPKQQYYYRSVKCNQKNPKEEEEAPRKAHRRNVLIGLGAGGLCGSSTSLNPFAFAAPISPPDLTTCGPADLPTDVESIKRKDYNDSDWLESGFLFYDENKNLVRVKVKDSLDTRKLGYVYQDVDLPWLNAKPKPNRSKVEKQVAQSSFGIGPAHAAEFKFNTSSRKYVEFPFVLDSVVSAILKRPKKSRSKKEKEEEEEVLVIEGIEVVREKCVKFDVLVNDEDDKVVGPENTEFAGSFVNVPHLHKHKKMKMNTCLRLGLTDLLEDLGADDDDSVVVTLVPRFGSGLVKIHNIKIELED